MNLHLMRNYRLLTRPMDYLDPAEQQARREDYRNRPDTSGDYGEEDLDNDEG